MALTNLNQHKCMKLYPSPFSIGDRFEFSNKHGNVTLEAVAASQPVKAFRREDAPPECLLTWDEIEQIALITDQVRLQPLLGPDMVNKANAFIRHDTTSSAGWVKVVTLNYTGKKSAQDQIEADMNGGRNHITL